MASSATFIQVSENDPALDLATLVVNLTFAAEEQKENKEKQLASLQKLATEQKYAELLEKTVFASSQQILAAEENDIATIFNISFSLLHNLTADVAAGFVQRFATALTQDTTNSALKLKLLSTLFNLLGAPALRYLLLVHILKFTLASNQTAAFGVETGTSALQRLEQWAQEWKLDAAKSSELYFLGAEVAKVNKDNTQQLHLLKTAFRALETADAALLAPAKEKAAFVAKHTIESPVFGEVDALLNLKVIKQLQTDAQYGVLYQLLQIVTKDTVHVYQQFYAKNQAALQKLGFDHEAVLRKMRVMTICTIGEDRHEVTYDSLLKELELKSDQELEECVIEAVGSSYLDARIEQNQRIVYIQRVTARFFDDASWARLGNKLDSWKVNLRNALSTIQASRAGAANVGKKYDD